MEGSKRVESPKIKERISFKKGEQTSTNEGIEKQPGGPQERKESRGERREYQHRN
jgi:hypothetical protein